MVSLSPNSIMPINIFKTKQMIGRAMKRTSSSCLFFFYRQAKIYNNCLKKHITMYIGCIQSMPSGKGKEQGA